MKVIRANTAGFCMGVSLALQRLDEAISRHQEGQGRLMMFGPIIHNPQVLKHYMDLGVGCVEDPEALQQGDSVVIRAHGIPRALEQALVDRGVILEDATCPKVKAAQLAIAKATEGGAFLLLFGEARHPEVQGLVSYAQGGCRVFSDPREIEEEHFESEGPLVLAAQTTQENTVFQALAERLRKRYGEKLNVLSTICNATSKRQGETKEIARKVEAMVVLGGLTSGNTRRLTDVARTQGIRAFHVERPEELPLDVLAQCQTVGLTAGASTPKEMVDKAERILETL